MNKRMFETTEDAQLQSPERNSGKRNNNLESKRKKAHVERKVGECYKWKAIGQCSKGDSCSFSHDRASGDRCDHNRPHLHQKRRHRLTERYPQKSSGRRGESPSGTRGRIPYRHYLGRECTASIDTLPCVSITSLNQDAHMAKNADSDTLRRRRSPARSQRNEVRQDQLRY